MGNIKLTIEYDGTAYAGWQIQPGKRTIQGMLTAILGKITQHRVTLIGASRTDAGVHALGQVAHFHTSNPISCFKLLGALNGLLPSDIAVLDVQECPKGFHARESARGKTYRYLILNSPIRHPLWVHRTGYVRNPLKIKEMRQASRYLVGRHDFRAFQGRKAATKTSVRKIQSIKISQEHLINSIGAGPVTGSLFSETLRSQACSDARFENSSLCHPRKMIDEMALIVITVTGDGFLKQMVRNIVGLLIEVGQGRRPPQEVKEILASRDRKRAGICAPAQGLYLVSVKY